MKSYSITAPYFPIVYVALGPVIATPDSPIVHPVVYYNSYKRSLWLLPSCFFITLMRVFQIPFLYYFCSNNNKLHLPGLFALRRFSGYL